MIPSQILNQMIFDTFARKITPFEASNIYPLDEYIETFRATRAAMTRLIADLNDAQAAYADPSNPIWSISETVSHLLYSQNGFHNGILNITQAELPHMAEAARGFGEGAKQALPAAELRRMLAEGTARILDVIEATRAHHDPQHFTSVPLFGQVAYQTWIFLLLAHETDHYRQSVVMRRLAKAALPG